MLYSVELFPIINNQIINSYRMYDYRSELHDNDELVKEILETFKDKFGNFVVANICFSCDAIEKNNVKDEYKDLYEESLKEKEEYLNSKEVKQKILKGKYKITVEEIKNLIEESKETEMLDTQEFLDFLDSLNQLSLDPDRK